MKLAKELVRNDWQSAECQNMDIIPTFTMSDSLDSPFYIVSSNNMMNELGGAGKMSKINSMMMIIKRAMITIAR